MKWFICIDLYRASTGPPVMIQTEAGAPDVLHVWRGTLSARSATSHVVGWHSVFIAFFFFFYFPQQRPNTVPCMSQDTPLAHDSLWFLGTPVKRTLCLWFMCPWCFRLILVWVCVWVCVLPFCSALPCPRRPGCVQFFMCNPALLDRSSLLFSALFSLLSLTVKCVF